MIDTKVEVVTVDDKLQKEIEKVLDEVNVDGKTDKKEGDDLAKFVSSCFEESENARKETEDRWLTDLRQYRGQYDPDTISKMDPNRSKAYIRITRTKVKTVDSRLCDFLFPANGDKNWGIDPTPYPDFSDEQQKMLAAMYVQETGQQITPEELEMLVGEEARKKTRRMEKTIEDQLIELKYREIMREVVHSGNVYGTGVLKGPLVSIVQNKQYKKNKGKSGKSEWILQHFDQVTPFIESVPVWDIYPDMEATSIDDCRYIIQRRKMDKHELSELTKRSDFAGKKIKKYLKENPDGDFEKKSHELELQSLGNVVQTNASANSHAKKYEVLEFWGYVDAEDLEKAGVSVPEKLKGNLEVAANVWVLGCHVIKASIMPMEGIKWPYFFYYYDKDETSIFGEGIPTIMRDVQELTNSAFRAMLDNAAISAGPQIEVNLDLLSDLDDATDIRPFKTWLRTGAGPDAASPAIRVFQLPSYTLEFERLAAMFKEYGDEVTTIPRYMWGEQAGGAGRTASGLSMMMGSANITIKDQVKNFDDGITKPFITAMYHWNMQFNEDPGIKGDYTVVAKGTSSLIAKEVYANTLIQFASITNNPTDINIVKRPNVIRGIADALDLGDKGLVYSEKEMQVQQQQQQQAAEEERAWMSQMVEAAREHGVSPQDLINNLKLAKQDVDAMAQQAAALQQQQAQSAQPQSPTSAEVAPVGM